MEPKQNQYGKNTVEESLRNNMSTEQRKEKPPTSEFIRWLIENGCPEEAKQLEAKYGKEQSAKVITATKPSDIGSFNTENCLNKFITQDKQMLAVKNRVRVLSTVNDPVIITGETGTGKELLANALHGVRTGQFVDINCAGMPENLIEAELFGARKGAYTGCDSESTGLLEAANEGTIFLDEIGELGLKLQAKLLRAIQEHKIRKVGGTKSIDISCRFVAATHCNLKTMVKDGLFRRDLYARLSVFEITTTPLANRQPDCELIAKAMCPTFPSGVDWSQVDLDTNVRAVQKIVRRWEVLGLVPGLTV